jgi:hypothetical protein
MVTYEMADRVAELLRRQDGFYLLGVGIVFDGDKQGYAVSVRIDDRCSIPSIPEEIEGVSIHVEKRRKAKAL